MTCDDDAGRGPVSYPAQDGGEVQAGEPLGEGEEVGGAHDDEARDDGVHHQVARPEAEEEGGLYRLGQQLRIHLLPLSLSFIYLESTVNKIHRKCRILKGQSHEIFCSGFFLQKSAHSGPIIGILGPF